MEDLGGFGRAAEKFLGLIESSVGKLYRPRAIRQEGRALADAEAYKIISIAKADQAARLINYETEHALAERAVARLREQEMAKQFNIEAIVDKAAEELGTREVNDELDKDWLHYFFEGCATISNAEIQGLWAKVLAGKATSGRQISRKVVDCLRWLEPMSAQQFLEFAPLAYLYGGFFTEMVQFNEDKTVQSFAFPVDGHQLEEIGLLKENLAKTFSFDFASLRIICQELTDRSLQFRDFFELTNTGEQLAMIVCPAIFSRNELASENALNRYDEIYSSEGDKRDSLILPREARINLAVGAIVNFLIEIAATVKIEKPFVTKRGKEFHHNVSDVFSIHKPTARKMEIWRAEKGRAVSDLHEIELAFLDSLTEYLTINKEMICH
jgi:hypothetical protein